MEKVPVIWSPSSTRGMGLLHPLLLQLAVSWKGPEVFFPHGTQLWMCLPCACNLSKEVTLSVSRVTPKALSSAALPCCTPRAPSYMRPQASL